MPASQVVVPHVDETNLRAPRTRRALAVLLVAALAVVVASSAEAQVVADKNGVLTDSAGKTLYTFDKDTAGKSNCTGACVAAWPPFVAQEAPRADGAFTQIMRDDGRLQWARDGKPLYFFAGDGAPGDVKGHGVAGVWHAVKIGSRAAATSTYDTSYYYKY